MFRIIKSIESTLKNATFVNHSINVDFVNVKVVASDLLNANNFQIGLKSGSALINDESNRLLLKQLFFFN